MKICTQNIKRRIKEQNPSNKTPKVASSVYQFFILNKRIEISFITRGENNNTKYFLNGTSLFFTLVAHQ